VAQEGMVDVSGKDITRRTAQAAGTIVLGEEAFAILVAGTCAKGDVLATARIAAIQAVKAAPGLIPMCHPVLVEAVKVDFDRNERERSVTASVTVTSSGKTGVEIEALTAAAVACLTIYDMLKYVGKGMVIGPVRLLSKTGGKSGDYHRHD
jgi:cyclic pyranopterin monophosphate synthase